MNATTHGRCSDCNVIYRWPAIKGHYRVTKGEAFCPVCGRELDRTAARNVTRIRIVERKPIDAKKAEKLRASTRKDGTG